ncbi:unnamed protein product [Sphagnum balticum]
MYTCPHPEKPGRQVRNGPTRRLPTQSQAPPGRFRQGGRGGPGRNQPLPHRHRTLSPGLRDQTQTGPAGASILQPEDRPAGKDANGRDGGGAGPEGQGISGRRVRLFAKVDRRRGDIQMGERIEESLPSYETIITLDSRQQERAMEIVLAKRNSLNSDKVSESRESFKKTNSFSNPREREEVQMEVKQKEIKWSRSLSS